MLAAAYPMLSALPSLARADCAIPEERAVWLATNARAGARAFVWLGQPRGLAVPVALEASIAGAPVRLPITWAVPGLAQITIPPGATGTLILSTPPRAANRASEALQIPITAGPPPARVSAPPAHVRCERASRPLHYDPAAEFVTVRFDATAPARHLLARWGRVGSYVTLEPGGTSAEIFAVGRCGNRPLDVPSPRSGDRVELAFLDDEGNLSSFTGTVAP